MDLKTAFDIALRHWSLRKLLKNYVILFCLLISNFKIFDFKLLLITLNLLVS